MADITQNLKDSLTTELVNQQRLKDLIRRVEDVVYEPGFLSRLKSYQIINLLDKTHVYEEANGKFITTFMQSLAKMQVAGVLAATASSSSLPEPEKTPESVKKINDFIEDRVNGE